jgi:hypothetical protein
MGGVDESLRISSDMQAMGWLLQQGDAALIPTIGYWRRVHGANTTNNRTRMCYEISVVVSQLLQTAECLKLQPAVVEQGRAMVRGSAYMLRQAQRYREATELYRLLSLLGESSGATATAMAKVQLHRIMAKIFRWLPEYSEFTRPRGTSAGEIDTTSTAQR